MLDTHTNIPSMAADQTSKPASLSRKNSFQEKFASLRGTLNRKRSNNSMPFENSVSMEDQMNEANEMDNGMARSSGGLGIGSLPPLSTGGLRRSLSVKGNTKDTKKTVSMERSSDEDLKPSSNPTSPTESTSFFKSLSLGRPKSALKKNAVNLSMPSGLVHPPELRSAKSAAQIGNPVLFEDEASSEALDQVSELKLTTSTVAYSSGLVSGSADSLGMVSMGNSIQDKSQLNKHAKSLPKITTLFTPKPIGAKKVRSSSATPGCDASLMPPQSPLSQITPLAQNNRKGGLSAYEISSSSTAPGLHRDYHLDDFHIVRRVGKGGFANVFLVRLKHSTGRYYALKAIKKADVVKLKQEKQIMNEKNILRNVTHPFIVELYHTFQNVTYLFMTMEYVAGGDLFSYLRKMQRFSEEDARFYVSEVLIALEYLHTNNIIYRDLKPENILLDTTGHTKLADFGFAKIVPRTTQSFCGTPDYIAAEIVANRPYGKGVDWWSLGVLIFELISGKTPFGDDHSEKIYENISAGRVKWHALIRGPAKDLIKSLLHLDPQKRLGSVSDGAEIRNHAWFKPVVWKKAEMRQTSPPFVPACEAPEVIERERIARGIRPDEYMEALKRDAERTGFYGDPFVELFKDF